MPVRKQDKKKVRQIPPPPPPPPKQKKQQKQQVVVQIQPSKKKCYRHACLTFPIARVKDYLHTKTKQKFSIQRTTAVYLCAVLEYLTAELLEIAGHSAQQNKLKRIRPRDIQIAVKNDEEFSKLLNNTIVPDGGVLPWIHDSLLPENSKQC